MTDVLNAVSQMAILLIVTAVGYLAARLGYLDMRVKDKITGLLLNITLPCMILASASGLNVATLGPQLPQSLLLGVVAFFLWLLVAFAFNVVFRVPKDQRLLYCFMSVCSNTSFVGIPVADALYGQSAALLCSVFIMATATLMYSIGIFLLLAGSDEADVGSSSSFQRREGEGSSRRLTMVRKAVISPMTIAALLAIALTFSGFKIPLVIQGSMDLIGSITAPLAMMLIGVIIANERISNVVKEWRIYAWIIVRQLLASAFFYLVLRNFVSDPILLGIFVVMFAMPVGSMAPMFCASYGKDSVLPAKGTILSTIASFVVVPALIAFMSVV